jgi:hypothetical protein
MRYAQEDMGLELTNGLGGMWIGRGVFRLGHRGVNGGLRDHGIYLLVGGVAAVDQPVVRRLFIPLRVLLHHRRQRARSLAHGGHFNADDDLGFSVGGELGVVGRPETAIFITVASASVVAARARSGRLPMMLIDRNCWDYNRLLDEIALVYVMVVIVKREVGLFDL